MAEAIELIATEDPDLAIIVVHHDDEHALALIAGDRRVRLRAGDRADAQRRRRVRRPRRRARASPLGSSRTTPEIVQGAIEVALRRYEEADALQIKVDQLESALERRALIERAKGILMERHGLDDREAFELLRDHARAQNRRVVDVARAVTDGHALLPKRG